MSVRVRSAPCGGGGVGCQPGVGSEEHGNGGGMEGLRGRTVKGGEEQRRGGKGRNFALHPSGSTPARGSRRQGLVPGSSSSARCLWVVLMDTLQVCILWISSRGHALRPTVGHPADRTSGWRSWSGWRGGQEIRTRGYIRSALTRPLSSLASTPHAVAPQPPTWQRPMLPDRQPRPPRLADRPPRSQTALAPGARAGLPCAASSDFGGWCGLSPPIA